MITNPTTVSVIVAAYNAERTIDACLRALFDTTYPDFEVIVVDDGSTDATREIAATFPCLLIRGAHEGAAAARNLGAQHSRASLLFFVDSDVLVRPDSVARVVSVFASRPGIGALFGSFGTDTRPDNFVTVYKNLRHHYTHQTAEEDAETFCGGFGAIYRETFLGVGGFDPRHLFLEDIEMGYRLRRAGVSIALVKDLLFTHCKAYTLGSLITSDLFGRAVPWTRLMLSARVFRNDLNTRSHNVASLPLSFLLAAGILLLAVTMILGAGSLLLLAAVALGGVAFVGVNRQFLSFLARERGARFAAGSAALLWLGYLYSGIGMAIGVWQHVTSREREVEHEA